MQVDLHKRHIAWSVSVHISQRSVADSGIARSNGVISHIEPPVQLPLSGVCIADRLVDGIVGCFTYGQLHPCLVRTDHTIIRLIVSIVGNHARGAIYALDLALETPPSLKVVIIQIQSVGLEIIAEQPALKWIAALTHKVRTFDGQDIRPVFRSVR
ncbi:hypothetical protein D3C73_795390 [compost metagenome]